MPSGTRFYLTLALVAPPRTGDSSQLQALREALLKELQSLPGVVVATGAAHVGAQLLQKHHVKGFYLDGTVQLQSTAWAGGQQISCQVQVTVATWPQRAVKMMSTQGAALQTGTTTAEQTLGQRDCLMATAGLTREDIQTYLQTLP